MYSFLVTFLFTITAIQGAVIKSPKLHPDAGLNIIELATKYGYPIESHQVLTEDGYVLTLHRIPHGVKNINKETGIPVLLMHGLLSSSVDWINMGPGTALGLLLADEGFDVWMGNQRGNTWSRKHVQLDPDENPEQFFNFSFHEIGVYDLPAKIDYILEKTSHENLFYVGHSQGTTTFFIMTAEKPEYNEKIRLMTALAPVAYMGNFPNPFIQQAIENEELVNILIKLFHIHEFLPHYEFFTELGDVLCSETSNYQELCTLILNAIAGFDNEIDPDFIPVITTNAPAGSSIKQLQHYFQEVNSDRFCQFDYGPDGNMQRYGQDTPPSYNISQITAPVILYYSGNDALDAVADVERLARELPNLANQKKISLEKFNHLDFLWSKHVVELLNNDVIAEIKSRS